MTTMEIILCIEIVAAFLLLCFLLALYMRSRNEKSRSQSKRAANAGQATYAVPAGQTYMNRGTEMAYVPPGYTGMPYYPGYPVNGNAYGNMPYNMPGYGDSHSYYVNQGYGLYPPYQDPDRTCVHRGSGYTGAPDGYYPAGAAGDQTQPGPSPLSGMEGTLYTFPDGGYRSVGGAGAVGKGETGRFDSPGSSFAAQDRENLVSAPDIRWQVDFMEMSSGRHVVREFSRELVVGRQMPAPMETGRLYLSMDATVSRSQFCLYSTNKGIMIENLSTVNITRKNGRPLWQPVLLEEGDILELGRMRYMIKGIRQAA